MKKIVFMLIALVCIFLQSLKSQGYIDVKLLPRPDCKGGKLYQTFDSHKDKILVLPNSVDDSVEFNRILAYWKRGWDNLAIKYESELTESDYSKALNIYGPIQGYKHWEKFGVPIANTKGGFVFRGKTYSGVDDGLTYLSPNRYVYTGNSPSIIWKLQRTLTGYYEYFVIRNGLLSLVRIPEKPEIDLDEIRRVNYTMLPSKFYHLFVAKQVNANFPVDSIVESICKTMHLSLPDFKITAYVHSDPNAARLFANFFFVAGCDILPDSMKFGTAQFGSIHTVGSDYQLLQHESFHILWEGLVGHSGGNEFFAEGIQTYYQFMRDTVNYTNALAVAQKHIDFDITNLVLRGNMQDFWGGPSENGWPIAYSIAGLFVKSLIDQWGLDKFKQLYVIEDKETAFKNIYSRTTAEVIDGYKKFIK